MDASQRLLDTGRRSLESGISESVISLSAFPDTPTHTTFSTSLRTGFRRKLPSVPSSPHSSPPSSTDWHEGASSISRGTHSIPEENLPGITTSFITNALARSGARDSASEITYPPSVDPSRQPSLRRAPRPPKPLLPPHLHTDSNHPSYSFPRSKATDQDHTSVSEESTPFEQHAHIRSDVRTTSFSRVHGAQVVGVAPAVLHSFPTKCDSAEPAFPRLTGSQGSTYPPAYPSQPPLPSTPVREGLLDSSSVLSLKSYSPSFVSSYVHSLRRVIHHLTKSNPPPPPPPKAGPSGHGKSTAAYPTSPSLSHLPILNKQPEDGVSTAVGDHLDSAPLWQRASYAPPSPIDPVSPVSPKVHRSPLSNKKKRIVVLLIVFSVLALAGIVSAVVVSVRSKGGSSISCPTNFVGTDCSINATCVCTSSSSHCEGLAQGLFDLIPSVNELFQTNLSSHDVYTSVWLAVGESKNCVSQANTIDLAPALVQDRSPNRRLFAQSALLWNLVQSQDLAAAQKLRSFVLNAPWSTLAQSDGTDDNDDSFIITESGFTFNFALQKVTHPTISFVSAASPSSVQLGKVGPRARDVLDRMYSVAQASASQRRTALRNYWSTTLEENPSDLDSFISTFLNSPVLLPFDAESSTLQSLFQNNSTSSVPPPLACFPGLTSSQVSSVNALESNVFRLYNVSSLDSLDPTCYASRPTYGRLDVLRLRLPFLDKETNVSKQAAALQHDVASRTVIYPWEALSRVPVSETVTPLTVSQLDYRQYGTASSADHIILSYLQSIQDINVASRFVRYILDNPSGPPEEDFPLDQMPVVEVAVFGYLDSSDFSSIVTSFTTKSGSIFFGSSAASALRDWSHSQANIPVLWTESANTTRIVRDTSPASQPFTETWNAAETALNNNVALDLSQITNSLASTGQFSEASTF